MAAIHTEASMAAVRETAPLAGLMPVGRAPVFGPIVTIGFATVVIMWIVWFLTHMPATAALFPAVVAGPLLLLVMCGCIAWMARWVPSGRAVTTGAAAGTLAGLVNLLIVGSKLVEQPTSTAEIAPGLSGLNTTGLIAIPLFLFVSAGLGAGGGLIARTLGEGRTAWTADSARWLSRFGVVAAVSVVPLLTIGGLVTSSGSGMAVPDWPGSYGANLFLYPISLMADPRIFLEHTHRLFGALVGLTTLTAMIYVLRVDPRRNVQVLSVALFVAVCLQGLMGGLRVTQENAWLGLLHGVVAQVFFAGMVVLAVVLNPLFKAVSDAPLAGRGRVLLAVALGTLLIQLVFGAMSRHLGSDHAKWSHVGFSILAFVAVTAAGGWLIARAREGAVPAMVAPGVRRLGAAIHAIVSLQFVIGFGALAAVLVTQPDPRSIATAETLQEVPLMPAWATLIRTIHQANGALLLALVVIAAVWVWRLSRRAADSTPALGR
jgi:cytochrome c oxidase assembly protein subunit 15